MYISVYVCVLVKSIRLVVVWAAPMYFITTISKLFAKFIQAKQYLHFVSHIHTRTHTHIYIYTKTFSCAITYKICECFVYLVSDAVINGQGFPVCRGRIVVFLV